MQVHPPGGVAKSEGRRPRMTVRLAVAALLMAVLALPGVTWGATRTETVTFSEAGLSTSKVGCYDLVTLEGARWLTEAGKPRLPLVPVRIGLPPGSRVEGVQVLASDSVEIPGRFVILPAQLPQPLSEPRRPEFVPPDASVYSSDQVYPDRLVELAGWGALGGRTICEVLVYPLRYRPQAGSLVLYTNIRFRIDYEIDAAQAGGTASRDMLQMAERLVVGSSGPWGKSKRMVGDIVPLGGGDVDYLIITSDALKDAFEPLREWKMRKGLVSQIVTTEAIATSFTGADIQEKVRNCIKHFHNDNGTDWVLLGGDVDILPEREAYVPVSDKPYIPCDLYYADLDGTWNADGDLLWGETATDGIDMYSDVFLGRAPVSNAVEAAAFVQKVLVYEGRYGLPVDYQLKVLFLAEVLWGDPAYPLSPDYTDAGIAKNIVDDLYVPPSFAIEKLYQSAGTLSWANAMSALDQGAGIINVCCHGHYLNISVDDDVLRPEDLHALTSESRYGLMYSASCLGGGFDYSYDCIGEAWVLSEQGGGFYIGNSRYGWDTPGEPGDGPSDYYDQSFFQSVFVTGFTQLGKAHADAKHEFVGESRADAYMRYIMYGLNLLGDPETSLWTATPHALSVTCAPAIQTGPQLYEVSVKCGGSPLQGAKVCLWKPDQVHVTGQTGSDGNVSLLVDASSAGTLHVTVTATNALPYLGETDVEDCVSAPDDGVPMVASLSAAPNPFDAMLELVVETPGGTPPAVRIFDVRGRCVACPGLDETGRGRYRGFWDGSDSSGRRCAPGIYFVRFNAGAEQLSRTVILLR
jgi:hypothetical protein